MTVVGLQLTGDDFANYQLTGDQFTGSASINAPLYTPVGLLGKAEGVNGTAMIANRPEVRPGEATLRATLPVATSALLTINSGSAPFMDGSANVPLRGDLLSANGSLSLALEDEAAQPVAKKVLNVYSSQVGKEPQAVGKYSASDMGNNILLEKVASTLRTLPVLQHEAAARSEGSVALGTGELLRLNVSMLKDATLLVEAAPVNQTLSNEELATYGLAIAKQRLGVTVDAIQTVVDRKSVV